jgi:uncharacterized protein (DUF488 family)
MKPLYTVGHQRLALPSVVEIVTKLDAVLVDVRSVPYSQRKDYNRPAPQAALGGRYVWLGDTLGGHAPIRPEGIKAVRQHGLDRVQILMCAEHAPGDCHRHTAICSVHFPDALHIFGDELLEARELERSIREGGEYDIRGSLGEFLP